MYYPGKVEITKTKNKTTSVFVTLKVPDVTLCRMLGGCCVTSLAFSGKDLPMTTSGARVRVPVAEKC